MRLDAETMYTVDHTVACTPLVPANTSYGPRFLTDMNRVSGGFTELSGVIVILLTKYRPYSTPLYVVYDVSSTAL